MSSNVSLPSHAFLPSSGIPSRSRNPIVHSPQHRRDDTLGRSNRDAQIDIISIDDRVALDAHVRRRVFLERAYRRTSRRGHELEIDAMLLRDLVLDLGPHLYQRGYVEGHERCRGVLRLL